MHLFFLTHLRKATYTLFMGLTFIIVPFLFSCQPEPSPEVLAKRVKLASQLKLFSVSSEVLKGIARQNPLFEHLIPYINYEMTFITSPIKPLIKARKY